MNRLSNVLAAALLAGAVSLTAAESPAPKKKGPAPVKGEVSGGLPPDARRLALGDAAPEFKLLGIDGRQHTLADYKAAKLLMVVFLSNHCPYSHAAETRLIPLAQEFKSKGLEVVAINPNSPDGIRIDELGYSKYNDSYEEMKLYAKDAGFTFPYLYDGDHQVAAKAYGCLATPHVFLFDQERKLRYVGRVDDSRFEDLKSVTSHDARNAVVELLAGKPVTTAKTIVMGCSTKWNSKRDDVAKADEKWKAEPVALDLIDAAGVAALAKNSSNRLRLINVWATWCAPCVAEFPELVSLSRRVGNRDFEMVTISMDDAKMQPQVKRFLEQQHAVPSARLKKLLAAEGRGALNYLYTGASSDALVQALDPEWPGPLPHTILVAPGGKVVFRHNGAVDPEVLKRKVIELLGPYYTPEEKR
ncbi:redoxin domain-containing protein [Horticoccus sp. 23ND18S-11]|uniref:redoxin domain-containing protein n=1 Tax=Horticoccus sp. 23ND18S-11 TaxID=3391832 RepID=UPI0039C9039C